MASSKREGGEHIAYFRALDATNQCELTFTLNLPGINTNVTEVKAVRQITDTVDSLLTHIQKKVKKLIQMKNNPTLSNNDNDQHHMPIPVVLTENGQDINGDVICKTLIQTHKYLEFTILHQIFRVIVNAPLVQLITLPVVIYADCMIQPTRCKTVYTRRDLSTCEWYKSTDFNTWIKVGSNFTYKTKKTDLNCYLKFHFLPRNKHVEGPMYEITSETTVQALPPLPDCPFETRQKYTKTKLTGKECLIILM